MAKRLEYENGTYLLCDGPWDVFRGGAALCADGKVRKLKRIAIVADTWFSVPASVEVKHKTVAGYVSVNDNVVVFHAYLYRKNHALLTEGAKDNG